MITKIREFNIGETKILFRLDSITKNAGLSIQNTKKPTNIYSDMSVTNLFQVKKIGDKYPKGFSNGRTMINSESSTNVKFVEQLFYENNEFMTIETKGIDNNNNEYTNVIEYSKEYDVLETWNTFKCCNFDGEKIEYYPSVTIEGISPYTTDGDRLKLTKYRSQWAMEGKRDVQSFANLFLEQCWKPSGVSVEKFGYTGSMPVNGFFPMISINDEIENFSISLQMHAKSSWQIEMYNKELRSSVSLGLPDRNFGDVLHVLKKGEQLFTPRIRLAVTEGSVEDCNRKLTKRQEYEYNKVNNYGMPIIFNEFCSTWGSPSHLNVMERAEVANKLDLDYYVIDAGWYNSINSNPDMTIGDWKLDKNKFPYGLRKLKRELAEYGLKLGIWFEFEHCASDSEVYSNTNLLLKRDEQILETVKRRFLDFKKEETIKYVDERVHDFINTNCIDYVKIDSNDSIGFGVDHQTSQGLGVIESVEANYNYYESLIYRNPQILFESCASGGHRLTLPFTGITNMSSFSDAHETVGIPLVAANLCNLFLMKQMQIWAVLKPEYSNQKLGYLLASTFLGRMCISGLIEDLSTEQISLTKKYVDYYKSLEAIIMDCDCYVTRSSEGSYNSPKGYQVVEVKHRTSSKKYVVIQSFDMEGKSTTINLGGGCVVSELTVSELNTINNKVILTEDYDSIIVLMEEKGDAKNYENI